MIPILLIGCSVAAAQASEIIKIGNAELIYAYGEVPIRYDGTLSTLRKYGDDSIYFFSSYGCRIDPGATPPSRHAWFHGPPEDPLQILDTSKPEEDLWDYNGYYQDTDQEGIWILAMHQLDNGDLLAITHAEYNYPTDGAFRFALGLGYSTDRGEHWTYCGEIAKAAMDTTNVGGGAYILRGDYIYAYFNDTDLVSGGIVGCVVRANLDEVAAAAAGHNVTPWYKYSDGQWDIPALSGSPGSDIFFPRVYGGEDLHADAAYCTAIGRYLMTVQTHGAHKLLLFSSEDGVTWAQEAIVDETDENVMQPYAAFVDYNSPTDDGLVVGDNFYIYYPRMRIDNQDNAPMYRRLITVEKAGTLFSQDFSSSTHAGDYVETTTPTKNQFTSIGGAASIDAGRLKLVNVDGVADRVGRWVEMEGTPVGIMSFSYEMDLAFSEADNTRLLTGFIGQPLAGNHWMDWGVDATGADNEWNVTGTTNTFTGAQTVTIFLNDSDSNILYADPAAGTQSLATHSYDIWVGAVRVAAGRDGVYVSPEKDLTTFSLDLMEAPAVTCYFDHFEVLVVSDDSPVITVYQDDFSGAAGTATTTIPEVSTVGFANFSTTAGLDGSGHLESTSVANAAANYRFRIDTNPLTADLAATEISYTVDMRTPTNDWVMVGFHEVDANGFLVEAVNAGPYVQFNPSGTVVLRGGTWGGGAETVLRNHYALSEVITAKMTYHVVEQTMDLSINGVTVVNGFALNHEFPVGMPSDPIVYWAQIHMRYQPSAANGGAYIDNFQIKTLSSQYTSWAAGWGGIDIGSETADYDGDGLLNLYEYGMGGDPTNKFDQGIPSEFGALDLGGAIHFSYVHPQLSDISSGVSYSLALRTNLISGDWATNTGYVIAGTNLTGSDLDFVTNVTDTVDNTKYMRLIIEKTESSL